MRKIIVITMITLDGVMQAPGGPEEDPSNGFKYGGWTAPYADDNGSEFFQKNMQPAEYLLGRKTFEIFKGYWPEHKEVWPGINDGMKYVLSNTVDKSDWQNTTFLKDVEDIKKLQRPHEQWPAIGDKPGLCLDLSQKHTVDAYRHKHERILQ